MCCCVGKKNCKRAENVSSSFLRKAISYKILLSNINTIMTRTKKIGTRMMSRRTSPTKIRKQDISYYYSKNTTHTTYNNKYCCVCSAAIINYEIIKLKERIKFFYLFLPPVTVVTIKKKIIILLSYYYHK